jgi:hypothetical protein
VRRIRSARPSFSKLSREITVAAKMGMPDPDMNPRLRAAVNAAKAQSMPKDNIQRAIDKASKGEGDNYEEVRYEGYGPGGVALIVEALTDNRNRTATNVRTAFRQERRQPGRVRARSATVRPAGPDRIRRLRRVTRTRCSKPRSRPAPTMSKATRRPRDLDQRSKTCTRCARTGKDAGRSRRREAGLEAEPQGRSGRGRRRAPCSS